MEQYIAVIVTAAIAFVAKLAQEWAHANLTPSRLQSVSNLAHTAVSAAEELGNSLDLTSAQKYAFAEDALISAAKTVGVRLKPEVANSFIHAVLAGIHEQEAIFTSGEVGDLAVAG